MELHLLSDVKKWAFATNIVESRLQKQARVTVRIALILIHVFFKTNISLRASALTYSIILALVPMLAMSTAILKGMGSDNELKIAAYRLIDQLEPPATESQLQETREKPAPPPAEDVHQQTRSTVTSQSNVATLKNPAVKTLTEHLRNGVNVIFDYADKTNFAALGAFGIIGLIFVILLMLNNLEATMNAIWHSTKSRPLGRKFMDYLALMLLLPVSLNVAFAGEAILQSEKIMGYITTIIPSQWLVTMVFKGLPFLFIVASLTFMYRFFPYARVRTYAAFIGAIFSTLCWFGVQQFYITLQIGVSNYNAIYGSFATVPLFLIWLQLGWMFLLLGAALAYAVQNRNSYHPSGKSTYSPLQQIQLAVDILQTVYDRFECRKPTTEKDLSKFLFRVPAAELNAMSKILLDGGLLYQICGKGKRTMSPVFPVEKLKAEHIIKLILGHEKTGAPEGDFSTSVLKAAIAGTHVPILTSSPGRGVHADEQ